MLAAYPADVDTVVFPNYESLPERDDVQDPFTEARRPALPQRVSPPGSRYRVGSLDHRSEAVACCR